MTFAAGRSDFRLLTTASTRNNRIAAYLQIGGLDAKPFFYLLRQRKQEIEQSLGETADWRELPGKKESHVYLANEDTDPTDQSNWPEQHAWLLDRLEKLHTTFRPMVKTLNAGDWQPDTDDGEGG